MQLTMMRRPLLLFLLLPGAHAFGMMRSDRKVEEMTCDALMAKSLVKANEDKAAAESERDETLQKLDEMTNKAEELQKELEKTTEDLLGRLNDANERIATIKKESKEALEKRDELARQYDKQMATLRDKAEMSVRDAKQNAKVEIAALKKTHEELLTQKETEVVVIKTNYEKLASAVRAEALLNVTTIQTETDASLKSLIQKHEEKVATLRQETDASMKAIIRHHEEEVASLQQEMNDKEAESKTMIEDIKSEATELIAATEKQAEIQISSIMEEAKIKINGAMRMAQELRKKLEEVEKERDVLDEKYKKAAQVSLRLTDSGWGSVFHFVCLTTSFYSQEIYHWEELQSGRSYCNFTYIQEDTVAAAINIQKVVADRAAKITRQVIESTTKAAEPHAKKVREIYNKLYNMHVQPQVDKTRILYQDHVEPHVHKHVLPFHRQYLAPLLEKLGVLVDKIVMEGKSLASQAHAYLVASYQSTCPKALEQLSQMDAPLFLVDRVNLSCQDANKTVNAFLWTLLVLLAFIFRKFLSRSVIIWFFSPLRLLFGKRKQSVDAEQNGALAK